MWPKARDLRCACAVQMSNTRSQCSKLHLTLHKTARCCCDCSPNIKLMDPCAGIFVCVCARLCVHDGGGRVPWWERGVGEGGDLGSESTLDRRARELRPDRPWQGGPPVTTSTWPGSGHRMVSRAPWTNAATCSGCDPSRDRFYIGGCAPPINFQRRAARQSTQMVMQGHSPPVASAPCGVNHPAGLSSLMAV